MKPLCVQSKLFPWTTLALSILQQQLQQLASMNFLPSVFLSVYPSLFHVTFLLSRILCMCVCMYVSISFISYSFSTSVSLIQFYSILTFTSSLILLLLMPSLILTVISVFLSFFLRLHIPFSFVSLSLFPNLVVWFFLRNSFSPSLSSPLSAFFDFFDKDESPKIYGRGWGWGGVGGGGNVVLVRDELESGLGTKRVGLRDDLRDSFRSFFFHRKKNSKKESPKFRKFFACAKTFDRIFWGCDAGNFNKLKCHKKKYSNSHQMKSKIRVR